MGLSRPTFLNPNPIRSQRLGRRLPRVGSCQSESEGVARAEHLAERLLFRRPVRTALNPPLLTPPLLIWKPVANRS